MVAPKPTGAASFGYLFGFAGAFGGFRFTFGGVLPLCRGMDSPPHGDGFGHAQPSHIADRCVARGARRRYRMI
jgi:hypothetical protein